MHGWRFSVCGVRKGSYQWAKSWVGFDDVPMLIYDGSNCPGFRTVGSDKPCADTGARGDVSVIQWRILLMVATGD